MKLPLTEPIFRFVMKALSASAASNLRSPLGNISALVHINPSRIHTYTSLRRCIAKADVIGTVATTQQVRFATRSDNHSIDNSLYPALLPTHPFCTHTAPYHCITGSKVCRCHYKRQLLSQTNDRHQPPSWHP
jgi:hypothetical protein